MTFFLVFISVLIENEVKQSLTKLKTIILKKKINGERINDYFLLTYLDNFRYLSDIYCIVNR